LDNHPVSCYQLGHYFQIDGKQLQEQYKDHISDFHQWSQKEHAADWMFFPSNMGEYLSIDEIALSGGELYTIVTNKALKKREHRSNAQRHAGPADHYSSGTHTFTPAEQGQRSNAGYGC